MNQYADNSPDAIRSRMAEIRQEIDHDVEGLMINARQMTDWTHYVRAAPLASMGVAALVGYLVVPHKLFVRSPDAETLAKLAKQNRVVVEDKATAAAKGGLAATAVALIANTALRAGIAYLGQHVGKFVGDTAAARQPPQAPLGKPATTASHPRTRAR